MKPLRFLAAHFIIFLLGSLLTSGCSEKRNENTPTHSEASPSDTRQFDPGTFKRELESLQRLANQGDARARGILAHPTIWNLMPLPNTSEFETAKASSSTNNPFGIYSLACIKSEAAYDEDDEDKEAELENWLNSYASTFKSAVLEPFLRLATEGDPWAALFAGECLRKVNESEAAKWYSLSSKNGNSFAQARLAQFYAEGKGVQKNIGEAVDLIRQSRESERFIVGYTIENFGRERRDEEEIKIAPRLFELVAILLSENEEVKKEAGRQDLINLSAKAKDPAAGMPGAPSTAEIVRACMKAEGYMLVEDVEKITTHRMLNFNMAINAIQRGNKLISSGGEKITVGSAVYPVRVVFENGTKNEYLIYKNDFNEWLAERRE